MLLWLGDPRGSLLLRHGEEEVERLMGIRYPTG
jgi:hypothetical protein